MTKKSSPVQNKGPVCKEIGCFSAPSVKGYCRLHFLKVVAHKDEGEKTEGQIHAKDRRQRDRFKGIETHVEDEGMDPNAVVEHIGELDTDIEDLDLEPAAPAAKRRKAG